MPCILLVVIFLVFITSHTSYLDITSYLKTLQVQYTLINVGAPLFCNWQEYLRALWNCAFPSVVLKGMISEQWKDMGWQGANPSTDFRYNFLVCVPPQTYRITLSYLSESVI